MNKFIFSKINFQKIAVGFSSLVVIFFPLAKFLPLSNFYNTDLYHNLWYIGYFGEYFARHHTFPLVLNTVSLANINFSGFLWLFALSNAWVFQFLFGSQHYPAAGHCVGFCGSICRRLLLIQAKKPATPGSVWGFPVSCYGQPIH